MAITGAEREAREGELENRGESWRAQAVWTGRHCANIQDQAWTEGGGGVIHDWGFAKLV